MRRAWPAAVAAVVALTLWVVAPEIYTGTFSGIGTFLRVAGLVVVMIAWAWGFRRFVGHEPTSTILAIGPPLVVAGLLLWPYFRPPTEVDEAFPVTTAARNDNDAAAGETPLPEPPPTATLDAAPPATTSTEPVSTATSAPGGAQPLETPGGAQPLETPAPTPTASPTAPPRPEPSPEPVPTATPSEPVELRRGSFQGLTGHRGSGDAVLYRLADGSILLRFEEVDIGSGPDLNVYVVPGADQRGLAGSTFVADLTAERGNQNYTPPAGADLTSGTWTVLVWCETFTVEVANATFG